MTLVMDSDSSVGKPVLAMYVCIYVCTNVRMYVCMYVCIYGIGLWCGG